MKKKSKEMRANQNGAKTREAPVSDKNRRCANQNGRREGAGVTCSNQNGKERDKDERCNNKNGTKQYMQCTNQSGRCEGIDKNKRRSNQNGTRRGGGYAPIRTGKGRDRVSVDTTDRQTSHHIILD